MDITVVCTRNNNAEGGRIRVAKRVIPGTGGLVASRVPGTSCILHNDVRNRCATIPVRSDLQTLTACIRYCYTIRNAIVCTKQIGRTGFFRQNRIVFVRVLERTGAVYRSRPFTVTFFCA